MEDLREGDILTRVSRYNLIRDQRLVYIDVHQSLHGRLAGQFVAVPNLINLVARPDYQGVGETESEALASCLARIKDAAVEELFPRKPPE
jgi:hypothetical protein